MTFVQAFLVYLLVLVFVAWMGKPPRRPWRPP